MLGLLNILLVAFPLLFGSVSAADEPQDDHFESYAVCYADQTSGRSGRIESDGRAGTVMIRVRTVTSSSSYKVRTAVNTVNYTYKKIQSDAPATFSIIRNGNSFNSNTWDDYLERLSRHTSGMRASVDRLFTLGSVRL